MVEFTEKDCSIVFTIRVAPRASKSEIAGAHDGALKVRIAAAPIDGAANEELIKTLAKFFDVPRGSVEILSGATAKTKTVKVIGASGSDLKRLLTKPQRFR